MIFVAKDDVVQVGAPMNIHVSAVSAQQGNEFPDAADVFFSVSSEPEDRASRRWGTK